MVIQANMSVKAIVEIWQETETIFQQNNVELTNRPLEKIVEASDLPSLLKELNEVVGSSTAT